MARYDSPGAGDMTPAGPVAQSTGAGSGSAGTTGGVVTPTAAQASAPLGAVLGQIDLSTTAGLSGAAGIPQTIAQVHANDTGEPSQTVGYGKSQFTGQDMSAPTSGQDNDGGYGTQHVVTTRHPNSHGPGRA